MTGWNETTKLTNHTELMAYARQIKRTGNSDYVVRDCREAIQANPDNPKNGYYQDLICYLSQGRK